MEQDQPSSLFEMEMDSATQQNLYSISKWTKFIAVTGFIIGAIALLGLIIGGREILKLVESLTSLGQTNMAGALIAVVIIIMVLAGAWLYFLYRSSTMIKRGLMNRSNIDLAEGFKAMRMYFVFSIIISLLSVLGTIFSMLKA